MGFGGGVTWQQAARVYCFAEVEKLSFSSSLKAKPEGLGEASRLGLRALRAAQLPNPWAAVLPLPPTLAP